MKGLFIPEITSEMFRNGCLESIDALMAEGEIYDIEYSPWIPVSERLPEKSGLYLVTNRANEIEVFSFTGHDMARAFWSKYAKAWQPLPKPYKAESEE